MIIKGKWGDGRNKDGNPLYDALMMDAILKMSTGGDVKLEGDTKRDAERMYSVAEFLLMYDNMGDMLRGEG